MECLRRYRLVCVLYSHLSGKDLCFPFNPETLRTCIWPHCILHPEAIGEGLVGEWQQHLAELCVPPQDADLCVCQTAPFGHARTASSDPLGLSRLYKLRRMYSSVDRPGGHCVEGSRSYGSPQQRCCCSDGSAN